MNYLDFELEIAPGSGREYPVAVVHSPGGQARETMHFPFGELELKNRLQTLQIALLRSGGRRRKVLSSGEQAVQDFGRVLFDALLTGEVRGLYYESQREAARQDKGLRVKLRIRPPELAVLPWEFLYDSRRAEYVCLSRNTPLVRYPEMPQPIQPLTVAPPLCILGMVVSSKGPESLDAVREQQRVGEAVKDLQADGLVKLTWLKGQTWRDLQRAMRHGPWHVFHFIGHGGFDRNADEGFIELADDQGEPHRLKATLLARLLANQLPLRLALLNSCEGARGGKRDIFSSTGSILFRRGIPAVLAMQYEITDRAAIELARTFYECLVGGMPVDAALAEARIAISLEVANTVEWGTPVLYMRAPDGILFRVRELDGDEKKEKFEREAQHKSQQVSVQATESERFDFTPARLGWLRRTLVNRFNESELRTLCFDLGLDYDDLQGKGKASKARELLAYLNRRDAILTLLSTAQELRPDINWGSLVTARRAVHKGPSSGALISKPHEPELILIPAGEFLMGSDPQKDKDALSDEQPQHTLYLPDYYLAKTSVTNVQYSAFVQATGHEQPHHWKNGKPKRDIENHPVIYVTWHDAVAYCRWLAEATGKPYRLPTEVEWEKGARGTDGRIYPWGNKWDAKRCNTKESGKGEATAVGVYQKRANPYGLLDMAGNVWEWTLSLFKDYPYQASDGRENLSAMGSRVLRGGAWDKPGSWARCASRSSYNPLGRIGSIGFRCCREE